MRGEMAKFVDLKGVYVDILQLSNIKTRGNHFSLELYTTSVSMEQFPRPASAS